ncbi:tRNA-splicing endonuclease subunit Sen34 [Mytilus galloprovincialis]|uniref:tRNA-splicing endonuclease subunit Sen34 n=1 Tax=Mytilus galloprovincialis TaxID=29158 RepID=A0A8B6HAG6_MYTGA|nr:tRNA-splicing endonuclease subunit Sen34 [Mytilus galloprovincialis]
MSDRCRIKIYLQNQNVFVWSAKDSVTLREEWRIVGSLVGCLPRLPRQNNQLGLPLQLLPEETTMLLEKGVCLLVKPKENLLEPTPEQVKEHEQLRLDLYKEQIELFKDERRKEMMHNLHQIKEGKRKKLKEEMERKKEAGETVHETDLDVEIDIDSIQIPPVALKNSLVQLYTESPYNEALDECRSEWSYPSNDKEATRYKVFTDLWKKGHYLTSGSKFGGDFLVYPGDPARFHSFYIAVCRPYKQQISMSDFISLARMGSNVRKTVILCSVDDNDQVVYTSIQWTGIA